MRVLLVCLLAFGCSDERHLDHYRSAGKQQVGFRTLTFVDGSRPTPANKEYKGAPDRTITVEVWYPAHSPEGTMRDAPLDASGGPYPLVIHSHGFMDSRLGEGYLAEHLASHGYVVAAPDYPLSKGGAPGGSTVHDVPDQPKDIRFVIDRLLAEPSLAPVPGMVIDRARIALSGLSLGGLTSLLATFHPTLRDTRPRATLAMAAPACFLTAPFYKTTTTPLLLVHGDSDVLVPLAPNALRAFERASGPRELVVLSRGTHTAFAGYASLFDPMEHYDSIGCTAIAGAIDRTSFDRLGTEEMGISADPSMCPSPCQTPAQGVPMHAERQQELVKALALSFFDRELRDDARAARFLPSGITAEAAEVTVRLP
jgi:predicted dienelactone hydrolase